MSRMDFLIWVVVARLTSPPDISLLYRGGQLVPVPDVTWFWYDDFLKAPSLYRLHLPFILGAAAVKMVWSAAAAFMKSSRRIFLLWSIALLSAVWSTGFLVIVIRQACPGQHHRFRDLLTICLSESKVIVLQSDIHKPISTVGSTYMQSTYILSTLITSKTRMSSLEFFCWWITNFLWRITNYFARLWWNDFFIGWEGRGASSQSRTGLRRGH